MAALRIGNSSLMTFRYYPFKKPTERINITNSRDITGENMKKMDEKTKSQWSGQFFVAGELTRRGYWVSIPLGNAPSTDIVAVSPKGEHFRVEVKTKAQDSSSWWIKDVRTNSSLFYVLVLRGQGDDYHPPKYWVVESRKIKNILLKKDREGKTRQVLKSDIERYTEEGSWTALPD